jgi:hypothetical protein
MFVCVYSVFVLSCVSSGLATGWSLAQGVLPIVYKCKIMEPHKEEAKARYGLQRHIRRRRSRIPRGKRHRASIECRSRTLPKHPPIQRICIEHFLFPGYRPQYTPCVLWPNEIFWKIYLPETCSPQIKVETLLIHFSCSWNTEHDTSVFIRFF